MKFMAKCLNCKQEKFEHQILEGLSQDITTPTWKFCLFFPNKFDDVSITVVFEQIDHPELELTYPLYVEMELCWTNNAQQICTKCIPNSTIKLIMAY